MRGLIKLLKVKTWWKEFFKQGHERTIRAKKNILLALLFKGIGLITAYIYFPISLEYLSPVKFGIFLTIASIIDWFAELDVGLGHGLRNRLGEAIADGNYQLARGYVSTAYFVLGGLFLFITIVFLVCNQFIPWARWLQANPELDQEISQLAIFVFVAFSIRFVASLIYQIFYSLQRIALADLFNMITKISFLIISLVLLYFTSESLVLFGAAKTLTFALVPVLAGFYFFNNEYKKFRPSIRFVSFSHLRSLFSLGLQFFLIKLSMIVIHQTNDFLIARFVSLESVPVYEAAYKYMSIFLMLFVILTNQLWSANLEAYRKGELSWMKKSMIGTAKIWLITLLISAIMVIISPVVYKLWLQDTIEIPLVLTAIVAVSVSVVTWVNAFNLVLNGTSKVRLQMYGWIFAGVVNIPLSIFLAVDLELGIQGIVWGTVISMLPLAILSPLQVKKILSQTDRGIWAK